MKDEEPEPMELPIDGTLDLHTFAPQEVPEVVDAYLEECQKRGILQVRIIHGKGIGMLRERVHRILEKRPDVARFHLDSQTGSGWGATLVELGTRATIAERTFPERSLEMHESIRAVSDLYKLNTSLFGNGVEGIRDETARESPSTSSNPILWIAGHVTSSRAYVLKLLGVQTELAWGDIFNETYDKAKTYPEFGEVVTTWKQVSEALLAKIPNLTQQELDKKIEAKLPTEDGTVRGALVFFMYHEAWHMGQIAYAKRCLGMEGLVPY